MMIDRDYEDWSLILRLRLNYF